MLDFSLKSKKQKVSFYPTDVYASDKYQLSLSFLCQNCFFMIKVAERDF